MARQTEQLEQTKTYLASFLQRTPLNPRIHFALGLIASEQGDYARAVEQQQKCIEALPDFAPAYRALADLLADARVDLEQEIDADLHARQQQIQQQISATQKRLAEAQKPPNQAETLKAALSAAEEDWHNWQREVRRRHPRHPDVEPLQLKQVQAQLGEQSVLLEYVIGDQDAFLFTVTNRERLIARLPLAAEDRKSSLRQRLRQRVEELRKAISEPSLSRLPNYCLLASRLYQDLIQPVTKLLVGKRELIIVADEGLHDLPFEALLRSDRASITQASLSQLPYLVRDYVIRYAPSASVLASLAQPRTGVSQPQKALLAFADPLYGDTPADSTIAAATRSAFGAGLGKLAQLPHSRKEVEGISKLYSPGQFRLLLGENASEENVKVAGLLSQYRIVHFSVHGLLNPEKPEFSGLLLKLPRSSQATPQLEDGLLQVYEVFGLRLNAELVVLSACESGLGKEVRGEGLMGLTLAFLYAGTPTVVVSLWKVAEVSTADLMIQFYRHLQAGKLSKAESLR